MSDFGSNAGSKRSAACIVSTGNWLLPRLFSARVDAIGHRITNSISGNFARVGGCIGRAIDPARHLAGPCRGGAQ